MQVYWCDECTEMHNRSVLVATQCTSDYSILFYSILFYYVMLYYIPFHSIPFYSILFLGRVNLYTILLCLLIFIGKSRVIMDIKPYAVVQVTIFRVWVKVGYPIHRMPVPSIKKKKETWK